MKPTKTECSNAWVDGLAASAASATPPSPPPLPHYSCRPCRYSLRRSGVAVILRGRALVRIARLRGRVLENTESSVGSLRGFCSRHISDCVRFVSGAEAGTSPRFAQWAYDSYRWSTAEAAG